MTDQTNPQTTRDLRLAARQGLLPARGSGWLAGFGNMLAKELGEWFRTRRWLWQILIWLIIIDGFVAFNRSSYRTSDPSCHRQNRLWRGELDRSHPNSQA